MSNMKISVLVPFGADDSPAGQQRTKVWAWNRARWNELVTTGLIGEVVEARDPLHGHSPNCLPPHPDLIPGPNGWAPFSVARALNAGARQATGDVFLLFGADHIPDPAAVVWTFNQLKTHPWVRLHDYVLYADEKLTDMIISGPFTNLYPHAINWTRHSAPCPGVLGVTRAAFKNAGGLDERFEGWGYEDTEFLSRLANADHRGRMQPSGLPLRELYVPSTRDLHGHNLALFSKITTERGW